MGVRHVVAATAGYLLGTVPSADLAAKAATGGATDLRTVGSGNPGAANAIKALGPGWGYGVMAADIAKGAAACQVGRAIAGDTGAHIGGTAAVIGHCFPVWNGFRGGKGVAASVGQCAMTFPAYVPIDLSVAWITATRRFRQRAFTATLISCATWVVGGVLWWRRGWPNLWGPRPSRALPLASAVSSAVIMYRFVQARHPSPRPAT